MVVAAIEFVVLMLDEISELLMWVSLLPPGFPGREGLTSIATWFLQVPIFASVVLVVWAIVFALVSSFVDLVPVALSNFGGYAGADLGWAWHWMVDFCPVTEVLAMGGTWLGWKIAGKPILIVAGGIVGRYLT